MASMAYSTVVVAIQSMENDQIEGRVSDEQTRSDGSVLWYNRPI